MEYEVIMENSAERDLLDILTYISKTLLEPATAKRIYLSIKEQAQSLDHMPFRYNVIQEEPYCQMGVRRMPGMAKLNLSAAARQMGGPFLRQS